MGLMLKNRPYILLLTIYLLGFGMAVGQPYGNEWIQSSQQYFKFRIGEDGIYRISRAELSAAGFPVSTVDPRKIQMYYLGNEIDIKVTGQADAVFNSSDYIEFYAKKADGSTDTPLYIAPEAQPNPFYNLFSDSSTYFITHNTIVDGARIEDFFENNASSLPAETFFTEKKIVAYGNNYYSGESHGASEEILQGYYDYSEGWTGDFATLGQSLDNTITGLMDAATSEQVPNLNLQLIGANNNEHNISIFVGPNSGSTRLLTTAEFSKDESFLVNQNLQWSDISAGGELFVRATVNGVGGAQDRIAISYITVSFRRGFDLNGDLEKTMTLRTNGGGKSYIEVDNPPAQVTLYDITDPNRPIDIGYNTPGALTAIVDNTDISRTLFLQSGTKAIANLQQATFQNIDPSLYNYLIVTHEQLRENTSEGDPDPVQAYKEYRESSSGGGHSVLMADINQVFDQFYYGLPSPIAIRNFAQYIYDNGSPEFLFLIGKASSIQAGYYRQDPESPTSRHYVPTWGHPGCDVLFTTGFDGGLVYESIATGRINADSPDDVQAYLNKVIEEESLPFTSLRQKNLVHLSGGNSEIELLNFRSFIDGFAQAAEGEWLGGESAQISKNNNTAVELINISDEINEGVMMVTFFGHSSGSVTDIEIGLVSDPTFGYSNKGKYPVFMVNGCQAGDFFSETESFGVDWILTPNLGAVAFMAHSHVAFANNLRRFTDLYYELAFNDLTYITRSVGEIKAEAARRFVNTYGSGSSATAQVQLMNLQGDPAVKVFGADKPDFSLDEDLLSFNSFDGEPILASTDSFYIELNIKNFGIGTETDLTLEVVRTLPSGSSIVMGPNLIDPVFREDTLQITIPNDLSNVTGTNTFRITLDAFNTIDELDESNNSVNVELFMSNGSTYNLLPSPYAIQSNDQVEFYFQSANILSEPRSYDFQIDTVNTFNSSYLISQTVDANVIAKLNLDLTSKGPISDGTVFYWRTRFAEPESDESDEWEVASFTLDRSQPDGWSQQRTSQLSELALEGLEVDVSSGLWEFISTELNLTVTVFGSNHATSDYLDTQLLLNGQDYFNTSSIAPGEECRDNSINFLSFKRQSTVPFRPLTFTIADQLNDLVCGRLPQYILNYTAADMAAANNPNEYIDALESGDNVLIFSLGTVDYDTWTDGFKDNLELLGINRTLLDGLQPDDPVIFLGAKDAPANSALEVVSLSAGPANQDAISLPPNTMVIGNYDSGTISTTKIGPALSWGELVLDIDDSANPGDDVRMLNVWGVDNAGNENIVYQDPAVSTVDLSPSGINIDPNTYPLIRLTLDLQDDVQFTPHQLNNWQLTYETAPEAVLLKRDRSDIGEINVRQEGESHSTSFTFWNISDKDFADSLNVAYDVFNVSAGDKAIYTTKIAPLNSGDSAQFTLDINTLNRNGNYDLILSANKNDQKERFPVNNEARLANYLKVEGDGQNPIVEVTFDGMVIIDGDIVSPNPLINMTVKDDNPYLIKEDTLGINFFIKYPCEECDFVRVPFSDPNVTWAPAAPNTAFQIDYTPEALEDGMHTLRIQAVDASGNASGIEPYEINFEVVNQSMITNFYPYPNPFSTRTQFVFTLTGSVYPEDLKIQIMTISGRVVKEIFMDELGPIRIGNNRTEYAWDGRDRFGDQLANGVYLYRVLIKNPGENFEHRETKGDRGFKHGFGKMYLLR
jgi:hypothetical protein